MVEEILERAAKANTKLFIQVSHGRLCISALVTVKIDLSESKPYIQTTLKENILIES